MILPKFFKFPANREIIEYSKRNSHQTFYFGSAFHVTITKNQKGQGEYEKKNGFWVAN